MNETEYWIFVALLGKCDLVRDCILCTRTGCTYCGCGGDCVWRVCVCVLIWVWFVYVYVDMRDNTHTG